MKKKFSQLVRLAIFLVTASLIAACSRHTWVSDVEALHLDNGMTILLLPRPGAPIFSAELVVKVGSVDEADGPTGLAHFFEHLAFKGTSEIGTKDYAKEKAFLDKIEDVGTQIAEGRRAGKSDSDLADLIADRKQLEAQLVPYSVKNEFAQVLSDNGAVGLNAATAADTTSFFISMPSNKMALWAEMESDRLRDSVLREFFTEDDVVQEEHRMRIESDPNGLLYQAYVDTAYKTSPYKHPTIGSMADIRTYTPAQARAFYQKHYLPSRMVLAIVGNFKIEEARAILTKAFSRLPAREDVPEKLPDEKLDGSFPRTFTMTGPDSSRFYLGYLRPTYPDSDDTTFDVLSRVLCTGRTSRLYKRLVIQDKLASSFSCSSVYPGERLSSNFTFFALPLPGVSNQKVADVIREEIHEIVKAGISDDELKIVKHDIDAEAVYDLESNSGMAHKLAYYQNLTGDYRYMTTYSKKIKAVTSSDLQRVAKTYFVPQRETTAFYETDSVGDQQ